MAAGVVPWPADAIVRPAVQIGSNQRTNGISFFVRAW
jgi:hypothetical protein